MRSQTNLVRRGSTYYFRKKIPADLQQHYGVPSNEIRISLRTTDKVEAAKLALQKAAVQDRVFDAVRESLQIKPPTPITPEISKALASTALISMLTADEEVRTEGTDEGTFEYLAANLEDEIRTARVGYARGDSSSIAPQLEDWLRSLNLHLDSGSLEGKKVARDFLATRLNALEAMQKRNLGEVIETPPAGPAILPNTTPAKAQGAVSMQSLVDLWASERKPAAKTVSMASAMGRELVDVVGHSDVAKMSKADIVKYKDALIVKHSESLSTGWKKLNFLRAVLNLAHQNERIKSNPAAGVKIAKAKGGPPPRISFSPEDVKAIFSSPIYSAGKRPVGGGGEAAYWLPLIGFCTGMRLEEIGQLLASDIRQSQDIWYVDINREDGKRLKNDAAVRTVPLHPALLALGFIDFVRGVKVTKAPLFPLLKRSSDDVLTGNFSKWFSRHRKTVIGITDKRKVFHSFRHTFKTACRDAHIGKEMHDAITGHREGDTSETYGEVSLKAKYEAMQRIKFDGLPR